MDHGVKAGRHVPFSLCPSHGQISKLLFCFVFINTWLPGDVSFLVGCIEVAKGNENR